ncbi:hypothetical protein RIF29_11945 [Crotalaria pallida]|uniref:Uncharacterized protein n=1 Tax=Crotalaria pallida TaxID=3830 RepID=A0AAN9P0H6_CROPI
MAEGRETQQDKTMKRILLIINCTILAIGATGAPLMLRLYFTHGGHRLWLSGFLQVGGFPIMLLPLSISYICRRRAAAAQTTKTKMVLMELPLFLCFAVIGLIIGANCVFYAYGSSRLPLISGEARQFESGEAAYYTVLVGTAMLFQAFLLGIVGVIFCASSLLSGVLIAVFLPMTEVLAIIFFKEKFHAEKGVALFLSLWGFISYFYGEIRQGKKMKKKPTPKSEIPLALPIPSP